MTTPLSSPTCPFCAIASSHPPLPPSSSSTSSSSASGTDFSGRGKAHLILSTKHVLAFLDIMPLTKGHVLVTTRNHWEKLGEVGVRVGQELGKWLPILSRVVMRSIFGDEALEAGGEAQWNVVQNNGERAAQVVPHVHFHIIPRPSLPSTTQYSSNSSAALMAKSSSWAMFGRGMREELDDQEGEELARKMREELTREAKRVQEREGVDLDLDENEGRGSGKL